jgi:hypothetical protein
MHHHLRAAVRFRWHRDVDTGGVGNPHGYLRVTHAWTIDSTQDHAALAAPAVHLTFQT